VRIIPRPAFSNQEAGIVLPVALFALLAATILTLAFVKANMISLRVGGASVVTAETQSAAELQLSNFFTRNPFDANDGRYSQANALCGTSIPAGTSTTFDCTSATSQLPPNAVAAAPVVQRLGCGKAPRSDRPFDSNTHFNYHQVATGVSNDAYGSRAEVDAGVATLIPVCP